MTSGFSRRTNYSGNFLSWALHGFFLEVNAVRTGLGDADADLLASIVKDGP